MVGMIALRWAASSETGRARQNDEDSVYAGRWLYAVADGMGGHAAGEVASAAVIDSLCLHDADVGQAALLERLGRAVMEANGEVARNAADDPGQLGQITEDHVMGKLVSNAGYLAPVLSRYLDGRPDRSPDLSIREARSGDRYLICSDGLSPVVGTAAIRDVLVSATDPGEAVRRLVSLAEDAGGPDNISVIVIDASETGDEPAAPVTLG